MSSSSSSSSSSDSDMGVIVDILDTEEIIERRHHIVRPRKNHMSLLDGVEFRIRFRVNKSTVENLLLKIGRQLHTSTRNHGISPLHQLLLTLRFYALGSMLISLGDFLGVSKASACRIVNNVSRVLAQLLPDYIYMSDSATDRFYKIASFPNVIGVVDGTHVRIQSPGGSTAEEFRNSKGYFSINVQGVCDADLRFVDIVARWPGSTQDSTVFNNSMLCSRFEHGDFPSKYLIGDSAYDLSSYFLTPVSDPCSRAEILYNESLMKTRNAIERCFDLWKQRFPVVGLQIRLSLERVQFVIYATAVLHNIAIEEKVELPSPEVDIDVDDPFPILHGESEIVEDGTARQFLINYFDSVGSNP